MKWIYKIIGLIFGAVVLMLIIVLEFYNDSDYNPNVSLASPAAYTALFNDSAKQKTVLYLTNLIKGRNAISEYIYDKKYSIVVYELKVAKGGGATLKSLMTQSVTPKDLSFGKTYSILDIEQCKLYYAHDSVPAVSNILITLYGDSATSVFKNDSISCVDLLLEKFLIQNDNNGVVDVKIGVRDSFTARIPMQLVFIHRDGGLFFIAISPINGKRHLENDLPQRILNFNFFKK